MILCIGPNDKLQVITPGTGALDVHVSGVDTDNASTPVITLYRKNTAINTATTTDITAAPASGHAMNVKTINICCKAAASVPFSVVHTDGTIVATLWSGTLAFGQTLMYVEGVGWAILPGTTALRNFAIASVVNGGTDVYLAGSGIVMPSAPNVGTLYRCRWDVTKTAAGSAAIVVTLRTGSGVVGDTSRVVLTFVAGTAAIDAGVLLLEALFRSIGSGTAAVIQARLSLISNLTTTGLTNASKALLATSAGFDSTAMAGQTIGASYNGAGSASHTIQMVTSDLAM